MSAGVIFLTVPSVSVYSLPIASDVDLCATMALKRISAPLRAGASALPASVRAIFRPCHCDLRGAFSGFGSAAAFSGFAAAAAVLSNFATLPAAFPEVAAGTEAAAAVLVIRAMIKLLGDAPRWG